MWYGDITYTPTREQWLYLATYLDLLSRKIIGWQASSHIDENLVIDALDDTANRENPEEKLMVRTNSGSQYTSSRFCREFEGRGFVQSFSRKGRHYDNAVIELFFKTLKRELPPLDHKCDTRVEARQGIFKFINLHYNTRRPHSSIGNLSPVEYERQCAH